MAHVNPFGSTRARRAQLMYDSRPDHHVASAPRPGRSSWRIISQTNPATQTWLTDVTRNTCTCPDWQQRRPAEGCKHQILVTIVTGERNRRRTRAMGLGAPRDKAETKSKGVLIVAPCGSGKSTWLKEHPDSGWVEGDDLYAEHGPERTAGIPFDYVAADKINKWAKEEMGMKVMTSTWYDLSLADAIVLPEVEILEERCRLEPRPGNDPAEAVAKLKEFNHELEDPRPIYSTIEEAVASFEKDQ